VGGCLSTNRLKRARRRSRRALHGGIASDGLESASCFEALSLLP